MEKQFLICPYGYKRRNNRFQTGNRNIAINKNEITF